MIKNAENGTALLRATLVLEAADSRQAALAFNRAKKVFQRHGRLCDGNFSKGYTSLTAHRKEFHAEFFHPLLEETSYFLELQSAMTTTSKGSTDSDSKMNLTLKKLLRKRSMDSDEIVRILRARHMPVREEEDNELEHDEEDGTGTDEGDTQAGVYIAPVPVAIDRRPLESASVLGVSLASFVTPHIDQSLLQSKLTKNLADALMSDSFQVLTKKEQVLAKQEYIKILMAS